VEIQKIGVLVGTFAAEFCARGDEPFSTSRLISTLTMLATRLNGILCVIPKSRRLKDISPSIR
jgi:hypothetical protein